MKYKLRHFPALLTIAALLLGFLIIPPAPAQAAKTYNQVNGSYTDNFADATGLAVKTKANVNVATGKLQLTNSGGGFTAPFNATGTVTTTAIIPTSIVQWGTVSLVASTTASTTIVYHIADEDGTLYPDSYIPGNTAGFSGTSTVLNVAPRFDMVLGYNSPGNKIFRIKLVIDLATTDTSVTPTIDSFTVTWKPKADVLPSTATLATDGRTTLYQDMQLSSHSLYSNSSGYYAIRWAKKKISLNSYTSDDSFVSGNNYVFSTTPSDPHIMNLDKNSGVVIWEKPTAWSPLKGSAITSEGILYTVDMNNDLMHALDLVTGELKWSYAFGGGHSNSFVTIGNDGTLYTLYFNSGAVNSIKLYAFSPDGNLLWSKDISLLSGSNYTVTSNFNISPLAVGTNGDLYFVLSSYDASWNPSNEGKLFAISPTDGSVLWTYPLGYLYPGAKPAVGPDGTIYAVNYTWENKASDRMFMAINPDGTLKWQTSMGDNVYGSSSGVLLRSDDKAVINVDGSFKLMDLLTHTISSPGSASSYWYVTTVIDGSDHTIYSNRGDYDNVHAPSLTVYDTDLDPKWTLTGSVGYANGNLEGSYLFNSATLDSRGWLYSEYGMYNANTDTWDDSPTNSYTQQNFLQPFALAPWTLSSSVSDPEVNPGHNQVFSVTTSMQRTNLLTGESNKIQVVMDNGDKVPLAYSSTTGSGDTIWTGSYTVPANSSAGSHTYTVQASAAGIQTDITTNFDAPAANSSNTGLTDTGSFSVKGAGGGLPPAAYAAPAPVSGGGSPNLPASYHLVINNNHPSTDSSSVTLSFSNVGSDITKMAISNTSDFKDAIQEPYASTKSWNLCWTSSAIQTPTACSSGHKTVYVKLYTSYGQPSEVFSAFINYQPQGNQNENQNNNTQTPDQDSQQQNTAPLPSSFTPGTLVLDNGTIYFISSSKTKLGFASMRAFTGLGYFLKNVVLGDTSAYTQEGIISSASQAHPNGSWIASKKTVYYVSSSGYIPIPSWDVFLSNHGQSSFIAKANKADLTDPRPVLPLMTAQDPRVGE